MIKNTYSNIHNFKTIFYKHSKLNCEIIGNSSNYDFMNIFTPTLNKGLSASSCDFETGV